MNNENGKKTFGFVLLSRKKQQVNYIRKYIAHSFIHTTLNCQKKRRKRNNKLMIEMNSLVEITQSVLNRFKVQ